MMLDDELLALLKSVDTPTICNALEVAEGRRGFDRFTRSPVFAADPRARALVGYARTAKIFASAPPSIASDEQEALRSRYYRYMAEAPKPAIAVIEDTDKVPVGAYWGEVNSNIHKAFGIAGVLTNGLVRDLDVLPEGFAIVAGATGPSHAHVHVREIGCEVEVFGMKVRPDELVHADRHGAAVIPEEYIPVIADSIRKMQATEDIMLRAARAPGFDFAAFESASAAMKGLDH